ncbi:right-handed parallel beta-helix repeat-containing protein [Halorarum halophilum]|uniref:Right-handed parallel beta-helix repeat-containing protein n=1 Tax=Halorarum halophilum TaxID=2743090 RepID=A0A7D5K0A9_9EURY|nr:right-handed parallel beta-helix repeat-containing protein [Halobaculum halophilum]QLG26661.1 right-handed parallel beta-helix repeat-containing protein [Halobaculum halophilum]
MSTNPTSGRPESNGRGVVVTTRSELEAAFEDLSPGETVYISEENAPYRTTDWLDIDVDDVTVVGPGVRTLIRPAAGANVGGFRIGHNRRCRGTVIRGVGYQGTPVEPRGASDRHHGIAVRDARNVTLERNRIRETYPRGHGDGGCGISVTRECSNVRIVDNRIHAFGDRGVQLGGERIVVSGNEIANGLDRAIACDMWYPDHRNHTAESVSIFGNMLGNTVEGSLVGVARNSPRRSDHGYVNIFGNVGFGSHKSFCHIRGPRPVRNVSIQNNVSRQSTERLRTEETTKFSGVAIDGKGGGNLAVKNNELYDYSGHGVRINSTVDGLTVQNNTVSSPGIAGIRVIGDVDGVVSGNHVRDPAEAGILLDGTSGVAVRGNDVRGAGTYGIVTRGSKSNASTVIAGNYVVANDRNAEDGSFPGVLVDDRGVWVTGNAIRHPGAPAIAEGDGAGSNVFQGNWTGEERPWRITSSTSRVLNNTPAVDVHRGLRTRSDRPTVSVEFDSPYARPPRISFGRTAGGVRERSFETDGDGNYVGVTIRARNSDAPLDVFVDGM